MKLYHNKFIAKLLAIILGLACALYFGWCFSYFGYWMGEKFHGAIPGGPTMIAIACWIVMSLAVIYVFFYVEYTKEDVLAYEDDRGDGSFEKALKQLKWSILILELFSLLFRWFQLNFALIGIAMIGIGLALLYLAHLFGKILHAQANVPYSVESERVMNEAGTRMWSIAGRHARKIKDIDKLRSISDGDLDPLNDVKDVREQERIGAETREQERRREAQTRRDKARDAAQRFMRPRGTDNKEPLHPFLNAQNNQADTLSQNGNGLSHKRSGYQ